MKIKSFKENQGVYQIAAIGNQKIENFIILTAIRYTLYADKGDKK